MNALRRYRAFHNKAKGSPTSPRGRTTEASICYDTILTDHPTFRCLKLGQTRSELLLDLQNLRRYQNDSFGPWSGLAPDGSLLFVRDLSTQQVYALDLELP